MNRRDFLFSASAGGILAGMPLATLARPLQSDRLRLGIIRPSANAEAVALATAVAAALAEAGLPPPHLFNVDGRDSAMVMTALAAPECDTLLGIMQPAGAVVFGALAHSYGTGLRWSAQHAISADGVRHYATATGLSGAMNWRDDAAGWEQRIAALYVDLLAGGEFRAIDARPPRPAAASIVLASFIFNK